VEQVQGIVARVTVDEIAIRREDAAISDGRRALSSFRLRH